ncbi:type II toxin-antitoxin system Phd/YefM family antitoxin [uncultured Methylobacterium sp.]|uniref:type II toxin-antitoxin system Phd/YefM family antitoxin n=1 Tax=uncultured Methylobacterium sp. TaxID=157278 RepID=UPI0035CA8894
MSQDATWTVAEAKAKFGELVETARTTGSQTITRNGRQTAVVVSIEEWVARDPQTGESGGVLRLVAAAGLASRRLA